MVRKVSHPPKNIEVKEGWTILADWLSWGHLCAIHSGLKPGGSSERVEPLCRPIVLINRQEIGLQQLPAHVHITIIFDWVNSRNVASHLRNFLRVHFLVYIHRSSRYHCNERWDHGKLNNQVIRGFIDIRD